jgi:anti-sigma factor RsiW
MTLEPGAHAGDALGALLDGELDAADEVAVHAHLEGCPSCTAELAQVRAARSWVRALPAVEPPFGFYERLLAPRRRRWAAASMAAAAVASLVAVVAMPPREDPVRPPVASLVRTHAITASVDGDPVSQLAPAGVPVSFRP